MKREVFIKIVSFLRHAIEGTEFNGHVFAVGGCVRDMVLESDNIKDIDIVVDLENGGIRLANFFHEKGLLLREPLVYERFGTSMFVLKEFADVPLEAVHTRSEQYPDHNSRNPVQDFGPLEEDCMRRDLTINALYLDITTGNVLDLTGMGKTDIKYKIIRTPRNPIDTYNDDPLRMLRCIRFATRYNWHIDGNTYAAIKDMGHRLSIITKERIHDELEKIFKSDNWFTGLDLLYKTGIYQHILREDTFVSFASPMLTNIIDRHDIMSSVMSKVKADMRHVVIMALMGANPNSLKELKFSNKEIEFHKKCLRELDHLCKYITLPTQTNLKRLMFELDNFKYGSLMMLLAIVPEEYLTFAKELANMISDADASTEPSLLHMDTLPIDGNDIMEIFKVEPSEHVKSLLNACTDYIIITLAPEDINRENCLSLLHIPDVQQSIKKMIA